MSGLPPTPVVWQEARAADGRVYYYNVHTKATQWSRPVELMTPVERALAQQPWKEYTTPEGRKYWSNSETKASTWEMPEAYKSALAQAQPTSRSAAPAPTFVAGGTSSLSPYALSRDRDDYGSQDRRENDRRGDYSGVNGLPATPSTTEQAPEYSSFEEAEAAFLKLLKRYNVQPDWTWEQTMRATIKDPQYRALKDPKDRKNAFEKYAVEVRKQEKEKAKERMAKLRADFGTMLRSHPDIKYYSRWRTIRPIIERETIFRSTDNEEERMQFFEEYIVELNKAHLEEEAAMRKSAIGELAAILKALDLEPYTRWSEAQSLIQANERIQGDAKFKTLSKSDILTTFENHIKSLERSFNDARQQHKANKARRERQNRDRFVELLQELRANGKIDADSKWMAILPSIETDPRYVAMLGQPGSTPLDLFWDVVEEEERGLRAPRNLVLDVLDDKRYEVTRNTSFDEFAEEMLTDRRTAKVDRRSLEIIFNRIYDKAMRRNEEEKHAADRHQRRAIDTLRSKIKHLDPPIRTSDSWDQVRPRVEKSAEFQALDSEDLRKSAFEKVIKRLREKEEDAERERERRRARREDDREYRNGSHRGDPRRGRLSRTPEVDAYEADRRKAMADREKQYRKASSFDRTPPPISLHDRDRDRDRDRERRDERHGRLDRSTPPRMSHYDRERRDREEERERLYRTRGDPRGGRDELNYGEESRSVTGSDRRRRRGGDSDGESVDSGGRRSVKRYRRGDRRSSRSRTAETKEDKEVKKEVPEPTGVHSGSEEGEIEED